MTADDMLLGTPRLPEQLNVRMDRELMGLLDSVARQRDWTLADVVRAAVAREVGADVPAPKGRYRQHGGRFG